MWTHTYIPVVKEKFSHLCWAQSTLCSDMEKDSLDSHRAAQATEMGLSFKVALVQICLISGFWGAVLNPLRLTAINSSTLFYPSMEAIEPQTIAQLREWGCRIMWSISDVSRTPFIGQMRLVTNYMSSWDVLCKLDLYSVAMLSQIQTDDGRMEKEQISLFTGSSSWFQTPQCIWEKKNVWTDMISWRKQQTDNEPQAHYLQLHTWTNT